MQGAAVDAGDLGPLPPQATGATAPGEAAAAAPPTAADLLAQSLYGDGGADALATLRGAPGAGPAPGASPGAPPPAAAPGPGAPLDLRSMLQNLPANLKPLLVLQAIQARDPMAGIQAGLGLYQQGLQRQAVQSQIQQRTQAMATGDLDFLNKLKSFPVAARPALLGEYFSTQGRPLSPAMTHVLADEQVLTTLTAPQIAARVVTDPGFADMFHAAYQDPLKLVTFADTVRKADAEAFRAHNEALASVYAPQQAAATLTHTTVETAGARLDNAQKWRTLTTPQTLTPSQTAQAQHLGLVPVVHPDGTVGLQPGAPAANPPPTQAPGPVPLAAWAPPLRAAADRVQRDLASGTIDRPTALRQLQQLQATANQPQPSEADRTWNHIAQTIIGQKPLNPAYVQHISDAKLSYALADDIEQLYRDPALQADRAQLADRLQQMLSYKYGIDLPGNLDTLIATQSLLGIAGGRVFISGRPNITLLERVWEHTPKGIADSPERVLAKTRLMKNTAARTMQNYAQVGTVPAQDVAATLPVPGAGALGEATPPAPPP